ncbi:methyltransferase [Desulfogranum mediterraneum]|uniref:methyltransferase n=1 Tax=Desulfogranum mediterraneum TaxID=160661 RepID=UPI00041F4532|nr:methyltransferase [Desulfogranum mediterraneum]
MSGPSRESAYLGFSELLTAYRSSFLLLQVHDAGLFELIAEAGSGLEQICRDLGWDPELGERLLQALCGLELLLVEGERFYLSPFSRAFLWSGSSRYQGASLAFEQQLIGSWQTLEATLKQGSRVHATGDKSPEELATALDRYLGAMGEAARERAPEFWAWLRPPERGTILEIGAGSGAFLQAFLQVHPGWQGLFFDLPEVVARARRSAQLQPLGERLRFFSGNYLEDGGGLAGCSYGDQAPELVLLSNVVHCQGQRETQELLARAGQQLAPGGLLVIHDFFRDSPGPGRLYDLHMMLNTYNGRTYSRTGFEEMLQAAMGPGTCSWRSLASGSALAAWAEEEEVLDRWLAG